MNTKTLPLEPIEKASIDEMRSLQLKRLQQTLSGRHGIYDMKVTNQNGEVVAMFRGKSAQIPGTVFAE